MNNINKLWNFAHKNKAILLIIFYKLILDLIYVYAVNPLYFDTYLLVDFNALKYILSWMYLVLLAAIIPKRKERVSDLIIQLHTIIMVIPMLTMYGLVNQSSLFMLMVMVCFVFEVLVLKYYRTLLKIPKMKNGKIVFQVIIVICTVYTYAMLIAANGIHIDALDFNAGYAIREKLVYPNVLVGYLSSWQFRIMNPYMVISSYMTNKKAPMVIFTLLQVLLYFIIPFKEILFSIILIGGVIILLKRFDFLKHSIIAIILAMMGTAGFYFAKISNVPLSVIPTRLLVEPAIIKFQHFEVFSKFEEKLLYSEGMIGKILGIKFPFDRQTGYIVRSYFAESVSNSNTGYIAYAYDNLGFLGMVIITLVFVALLIIIDSLAQNLNKNYVFALLVYQIFLLNDGDLLTQLLTGGLFITILILLFDQESFALHKDLDPMMPEAI